MNHLLLTSLGDLDPYKDDWERLRLSCHAPVFSSYDLTRLWLDVYRDTVRPQIIVVQENGELVGLAPMCTYKHSAAGIPIRTLTMIGNGKNIVGYSLLTVMAKDDDEVVRRLVRGVGEVKWNLMQIFDFEPIPPVIKFLEFLKQGYAWQPYKETNNIFYEYPLEGRVDSRFGHHTRKVLRGVRNGLEKHGRLGYRTVVTAEDAEKAMRLYVKQHGERWASKGGSIFKDERNARMLIEMTKLQVGKGEGMIYEVLIDGEVAAQSFVILDGDVIRGYRLGMNNKYAEFSPGKLAMLRAMEETRARGFKGMDLLRGKEDYKYHMMTNERTLPAIQAQRGALVTMSKVRNFPPVKLMDERLKVRERLLKRVYHG